MSETELQLLISNAVCDNTQSYVNLSMSPEEYRRLKAGIDRLAARESELAEAKRRVAELEAKDRVIHAERIPVPPHLAEAQRVVIRQAQQAGDGAEEE